MVRRRRWALPTAAVLALSLFAAPLRAGAAHSGPYACPPPDPALEGRPAEMGAAAPTLPVRDEPDGSQTIMVAVEDPADLPTAYSYVPVGDGSAGAFVHPWSFMPPTRPMTTYGVYRTVGKRLVRVPLFVGENLASADPLVAASTAIAAELDPLERNGEGYALNTLVPTPTIVISTLLTVGALIPGQAAPAKPYVVPRIENASAAWAQHYGAYPDDPSYDDRATAYVWTVFRQGPGTDFWEGMALIHTGRSQTFSDGTNTIREGCRRTRLGIVTRTGATTVYAGGIYLLDHVRGSSGPGPTYLASQELTAGATVAGVDVPIATVRQTETKQGASPFGGGGWAYTTTQDDEITIGAGGQGSDPFVPLAGTKAHTVHGSPPEAQKRLVSLGVFDPMGAYHPVAGFRSRFETLPADLWPVAWALAGGPGFPLGDWEIDIGTFDPMGAFVPVAGITFADDFKEAFYPYEMMITAGPWLAGTYQPALGITYDGVWPFVIWALFDVLGLYFFMERWYYSAGTFRTTDCEQLTYQRRCPYVPLLGISYFPGTPSEQYENFPIVEEYRVGIFPGEYSPPAEKFQPLVGARWSANLTSGAWALFFALGLTRAPADARLDAGPVMPGTGSEAPIIPVAGARIRPGRPDHYDAGVWVMSSFTPLGSICYSPGLEAGNGSVGIGARGGDDRIPLVWVGRQGGNPAFGALQDCPA